MMALACPTACPTDWAAAMAPVAKICTIALRALLAASSSFAMFEWTLRMSFTNWANSRLY
ncbi:hypothetical protein CA237_03700 [Sphingomonas sp. ABOLH]|nr:hypothetical protein CA237_03700 [Sphingomonas sp. ABOLH]